MAGLTLLAACLASASTHAAGGGWTEGGVLGAYHPRPDLKAVPRFERRDPRIDFRWSLDQPIGGSQSRPLARFPRRDFSVRWQGALMAAHTEPYVFEGVAGGGLRLILTWPDGTERVVIDRWEKSGPFRSQAVPLARGERVEARLEYTQRDATARLRLSWRSPSTPLEVIEPMVQHALTLDPYEAEMWADAGPRLEGTRLVLSGLERGRHRISFRGAARMRTLCCCDRVVFERGRRSRRGRLPRGSYDRRRDRSAASFVARCPRIVLSASDGPAGPKQPSGPSFIVDLRVMRPLAPGADEAHRPDELLHRGFKRALRDPFSALRWRAEVSDGSEVSWDERSTYFEPDRRQAWETRVMIANETGKDLFVSTPLGADDLYFEQLARLLQHGSDGRAPYSRPTPDARFPPLNSNLRIYLEVGDGAEEALQTAEGLARRAAPGPGSPGSAGRLERDQLILRWHARRTLQASRIFRRVFGAQAFERRVRPLLRPPFSAPAQTTERGAERRSPFGAALSDVEQLIIRPLEDEGAQPETVRTWIWGTGVPLPGGQAGTPKVGHDARSFGLNVLSYERAWAATGGPERARLQAWAKLRLAAVEEANAGLIEAGLARGRFMTVWGAHPIFSAHSSSPGEEAPLLRSILRSTQALPPPLVIGRPLPALLTPEASARRFGRTPSPWALLTGTGAPRWWSWDVRAEAAGPHQIDLSGAGPLRVEVDGRIIMDEDARRSTLFLTRGRHAVRVLADGSSRFEALRIAPSGVEPPRN